MRDGFDFFISFSLKNKNYKTINNLTAEIG